MNYFRMVNDYNTPAPDAVFKDIKQKSKAIWYSYDDTYGYASEKVAIVDEIANTKDNWSFIVGMFDDENQQRLWYMLEPASRDFVQSLYIGCSDGEGGEFHRSVLGDRCVDCGKVVD